MNNIIRDSIQDFELPTINRFALLVKPTQAFKEWAKICYEDDQEPTLEEFQEDSTIYLLPVTDSDSKAWIEENYKQLFEYELDSWCRDRDLWSKNRSFIEFKKFFHLSVHTMLVDMVDGQIEKEE